MDIHSVIGQLEREMSEVSYRIRKTNESNKKKEEIEKSIKTHKDEIFLINSLSRELKEIITPLLEYNADKQTKALAGIHAGISSARSIITDSFRVRLHIDKEQATLVNEHDDEVNLTEGSAFRAMNAFFMRDIILSNTNYLQFDIADEPLTTLSGISSSELSNYLPLLARNKQKILIEQKDEVFVNANEQNVYKFKKSEGRTHIEKIS